MAEQATDRALASAGLHSTRRGPIWQSHSELRRQACKRHSVRHPRCHRSGELDSRFSTTPSSTRRRTRPILRSTTPSSAGHSREDHDLDFQEPHGNRCRGGIHRDNTILDPPTEESPRQKEASEETAQRRKKGDRRACLFNLPRCIDTVVGPGSRTTRLRRVHHRLVDGRRLPGAAGSKGRLAPALD